MPVSVQVRTAATKSACDIGGWLRREPGHQAHSPSGPVDLRSMTWAPRRRLPLRAGSFIWRRIAPAFRPRQLMRAGAMCQCLGQVPGRWPSCRTGGRPRSLALPRRARLSADHDLGVARAQGGLAGCIGLLARDAARMHRHAGDRFERGRWWLPGLRLSASSRQSEHAWQERDSFRESKHVRIPVRGARSYHTKPMCLRSGSSRMR